MDSSLMKQEIMNNIAKNMKRFEESARIKLKKRSHLLNTNNDHLELVSDIIYSIINKLDKKEKCIKFYKMVKDDKLNLYILKGIDRNCTSFNAPFLRNKLKTRNLAEINYEIPYEDIKPMDERQRKIYELSDKRQYQIKEIYSLLQPDKAKELFGTHWKYFVNLIIEYIEEPKNSYYKIAKKYDIPASSVGAHIRFVIKKIKEELNYE